MLTEIKDLIEQKKSKIEKGSSSARRLAQLKSAIRTAKEEGHIGGETGVSVSYFERELNWLQNL